MNVWVEAARPRTLVAGIVPVAGGDRGLRPLLVPRFLGPLVVAVGMQIGVNFANDLFDAQKGVDTEERLGPRRLSPSGLVSPARMRAALAVILLVAGAAGWPLRWELAVVSWWARLLRRPRLQRRAPPYAQPGLGEVFVFVFFGLVATVGSAYVQDERITPLAVVAAFPVGLLAIAILVVNNLRDIATDARAGKNTLAVRLGEGRTRWLFVALLVATLAGIVTLALVDSSFWPLLGLGCAPLLAKAGRGACEASGRELVGGAQRNRTRSTDARSIGGSGTLDLVTRVFQIPLTTRFRRIGERTGVLIQGPAGWGEFSPFPDYGPAVAARWLPCAAGGRHPGLA